MIKIRYPDTVKHKIIYAWLQANCEDQFYTGIDWGDGWVVGELNRCVEFVSERDASMFALRWM